MKCSKCGFDNPENSNYCLNCGSSIHNFEENKYTGGKKIINLITSIFFVIFLFFSLIFIWLDVLSVSGVALAPNTSAYWSVGIGYYLYGGWDHINVLFASYTSILSQPIAYITLIITIIAFICSLFTVYIFGIKGLINGIRSFVRKEDAKIQKESLLVMLAFLLYYVISRIFVYHAIGSQGFLGYSASVNQGDGITAISVILYPVLILFIVGNAFLNSERRNATSFIKTLFLGISLFILVISIINVSTNAYNVESVEVDILGPLLSYLDMSESFGGEFVLVAISTLLCLSTVIYNAFLIIKIMTLLLTNKYYDTKKFLILTIVNAGISLISMVLATPAMKSIIPEHGNVGDGAITAFVCSILVLGLSIAVESVEKPSNQQVIDN